MSKKVVGDPIKDRVARERLEDVYLSIADLEVELDRLEDDFGDRVPQNLTADAAEALSVDYTNVATDLRMLAKRAKSASEYFKTVAQQTKSKGRKKS